MGNLIFLAVLFVVCFYGGRFVRAMKNEGFFSGNRESLVFRCPDCPMVISTHPSNEKWLEDVAEHHKGQHKWMGTL